MTYDEMYMVLRLLSGHTEGELDRYLVDDLEAAIDRARRAVLTELRVTRGCCGNTDGH